MPVYPYKCLDCGKEFDVLKPMSEYDTEETCECGGKTGRVVTAPNFLGSDNKTGVKGWGVKPPRDNNKATEKF